MQGAQLALVLVIALVAIYLMDVGKVQGRVKAYIPARWKSSAPVKTEYQLDGVYSGGGDSILVAKKPDGTAEVSFIGLPLPPAKVSTADLEAGKEVPLFIGGTLPLAILKYVPAECKFEIGKPSPQGVVWTPGEEMKKEKC